MMEVEEVREDMIFGDGWISDDSDFYGLTSCLLA